MGLALPIVRLLIEQHRARPLGPSVLTLGVQDIGATADEVQALLAGQPVDEPTNALRPDQAMPPEAFFESLGFRAYQSLDLYGSEGATIIHDLTQPVAARLRSAFDLVIDGGTIEHIFDIAAALRNIVILLRVGGVAMHVSPVAGWENHGFYSINPKVLGRFYRANGFDLDGAWLVRLDKTGSLRTGRCEPLAKFDAPFEADSLRQYTLLVLAARKREETLAFTAPVDTHQSDTTSGNARLRDDLLYWQQEDEFNRVCDEGETRCGPGPRDRYYVIKEYMRSLGRLDGDTAECGIYRGLGSWIIRHYAQQMQRDDLYAHHLFDSFEGVSAPTDPDTPQTGVRPWRAGDMAWNMNDVQQTLSRWHDLRFHRGWIPACFEAATAVRFAFVHIDVDLFEPTLAALKFFHPRLIPGAIIVLDDDGFLTCPGARKAVEEFALTIRERFIRLPTGQAVLVKAGT